jgi:PDZ domain
VRLRASACLCALFTAGVAGCALPAARQGAIDDCEHHGKRALLLEQHDNGLAGVLVDEGRVRYLCVPPDQVLPLRADFGAEAADDPEVAGAIIVSTKGAGIAARTGLQAGDVVYEVAGTPVASARALQAALAERAPREKVMLGVKHRDQSQQLAAQF